MKNKLKHLITYSEKNKATNPSIQFLEKQARNPLYKGNNRKTGNYAFGS